MIKLDKDVTYYVLVQSFGWYRKLFKADTWEWVTVNKKDNRYNISPIYESLLGNETATNDYTYTNRYYLIHNKKYGFSSIDDAKSLLDEIKERYAKNKPTLKDGEELVYIVEPIISIIKQQRVIDVEINTTGDIEKSKEGCYYVSVISDKLHIPTFNADTLTWEIKENDKIDISYTRDINNYGKFIEKDDREALYGTDPLKGGELSKLKRHKNQRFNHNYSIDSSSKALDLSDKIIQEYKQYTPFATGVDSPIPKPKIHVSIIEQLCREKIPVKIL